jgi:threonine/homoserine/homoserine lactone efflux protein
MYRQLQKLAILCNICFWTTLVFQLWEKARNIPEPILNTIIILGISALVVNIVTIAAGFYSRRKNPHHQKIRGWMKWVIAISAISQLAWLIFNWRFPNLGS